ncbi:MAG: serine/threonine protein kinase [Sandaracinaceae bacterium]
MRICPQCGTTFDDPIQFCPEDGSPTYAAEERQEVPSDPLLGRVIDGRYRIERQIGEGGMGVVYLATHTVLARRLALKVLRGDNSRDPDVVQRFMQEAQAATSIGHPNIIDISDFGRLPDGSVYFVMEYLDGASLADVIARGGSVPSEDSLHLVRQIASALEAAHARGIVHRDLKPDNVYLIQQGNDPQFVKVLDFGIAKVGGGGSKLTKTGMVFGTPHYMSPEQAAGHSVDQRTDVYALGVIMYEMFTGKVPFDADTFMGILSKHMFEIPTRPSDLGAPLGPLEAVILRALEKSPQDRYQTMTELLGDLDRIAAGEALTSSAPSGVAPPGDLARALEPSYAARASDLPGAPGGALAGAARWGLALVALVAIGGIVGTAVFFLTGEPEDPRAFAQPPGSATVDGPEGTGGPEPPGGANATADGTPEGAGRGRAEELPPAPAEPATIALTTVPAGAEILIDGTMVGNAPLDLVRPTEPVPLVLRLRGFQDTELRVGPETAEELIVSLERRRRPAARPRPQPARTEEPPPAPRPPARRPGDVVDPWAE